jgi:membrane peptidoglycan carboxypeptidase
MEFYLNNIYFANGYYGIQAASKGYFNKNVDKLSLSQIAFLCAIPNNPTIYDPLDYPENTTKRRDRILLQMYKDGQISKAEYDEAVAEKIKIKTKKVDKNNYVETYVFYTATRALMEAEGFVFRTEFDSDADKEEYDKEYNETYTKYQKSLYYGGYRIYTSIDMKKQEALQQAVDNTLADFTEKNKDGTYEFQGAAVSIDNETGKVVAIVGGRYQESQGYTLNRAYQSFRQPGSSIKPLIVYTPSFENGYYPDNVVDDHKFKGGPSNADGKYLGKISVRTAVEKSKNTIAWQLFEELTPKLGLSYLLNMNFAKIDKNDYYPAASLGGFTNGVSPLEITSAYAALENDGVYRAPTCILTIKDSEGNVIVENKTAKKQVYSENAARMMTDVMTGVIKNGTGRGLGLDNMISAGKTGTTNDKKDGWFVGYTPYYTTGVWVGYDIPKSTSGLSGASYPGTIWKTYMNVIHKGLENISFPVYTDNRTDAEKAEDQGITPTPTDTPTPTPTDTPTPTPTDTPTPTPEDPDDWEDGWEEPGLTEAPTNPDTTEGGEEDGSGSDDGQNNGGANGDEGSGTGDGETDFATP